MSTTTVRITQQTQKLLRMLKAIEDRDQVEILADAILEYAEGYHGDELADAIARVKEETVTID